MLIDSISTFKITAFTPLGDEDFHISLIDNGGVVGGRIRCDWRSDDGLGRGRSGYGWVA